MVNQNMATRLAEANARYQTAGEGPDGPPPGQYQMQLRSAIFRESNNGKYMIRWTFVILDGAEQGQEVSDMSALESESPVPLRMLKERIRKLGYEPPPEIWDYQELCPLITRNAPLVLASITHSGNYANVSIIEVLQAVGNTVAAAAPAPTPMQAVPPPTPVGIPAPAIPRLSTGDWDAAVGDTVQYTDPETGLITGVVDEIDAAGQATVGINETDAILAPATALTITAKAAVPAPAAPVPMPAVPTPTPTPGTGIYSEAAPVPTQAEEPLRDSLIDIATAFGIQVNDLMSQDDIVSALAENEWFLGGDAGLNAAEASVLASVGIAVTPAPAAAPAPAPAPVPAATPSPRASAKAVKRKPKAKKKTVARKKRG